MFKTQFLFTTGTIYLHDCSVQNKIPILLIVIVCVDSVLFLTRILCSCIQGDNKAPSELLNYIVSVLKIILHFFGIIPATAYVITAWQTWHPQQISCSYNSSDPNCCDPVPMYFTISVMGFWNIFGVAFCVFCCVIKCILAN